MLSHSGEVTILIYGLHHVIGNGLLLFQALFMISRRDFGDMRESSLQIHIIGLVFVRLNLRVDSMRV